MLPKIELRELADLHKGFKVADRKLVNIRGCNGSGKSTIPLLMKESDPYAFEVLWRVDGRERVMATVFPSYEYLALGKYSTACGGMDSMKTTSEIKTAVELAWGMDFHILMEGVLASTVRQTYIDLFKSMNESQEIKRDVIVYNLLPPLETCLARIQQRNGGKAIKEDQVESKWNTVLKNSEHFRNAGFTSIIADNSKISREGTLDWFFETVKEKPVNIPKQVVEAPSETGDLEPVEYSEPYIEPRENLTGYDWYRDYKEPNSDLRMVRKYFDLYWNFISERMNIWYKRVVLEEPAPWTEDRILRDYKFTNVVRDMDKLSIYERKNILSKIDEPVDDLTLRKMSVLLNIMMFRLWVKIETYEVHGFIDLADPDWRVKWEGAKVKLLERREKGISNFTAAYYVNDLHAANPDKETQSNKTMNAICMIEGWMNNMDELYHKAIVEPSEMKEQIAYFTTLPCVGNFTAYEYACSITMVTRYCKNHLVSWTQDNATNVGPGAKRGINWIFENKGGMNDYQCILYLRSIWEHELRRMGTYERFVSQLPREMNGEIDLRVIEHCLCETQKYNKALNNIGRPKESFKPKTTDLGTLKV